jgi:P-type Ca2+ transporter type 2C
VNDDKEISPLPPVRTVPSNLVPLEERTGHQNVATSSEEIVSETAIMQFEHDAEEDNKAAQNPFAFSPNTLDKLLNLKSLSAFYAFGGLRGLEIGLRTNRHCGLGVDETVLHGNVTFGDVKAALTGARISSAETANAPSALKVSRSSSAHTHGHFTDRKRIFKDNRLPVTTPKSFLQLMWAAYNDKVLMLLTAAAIVSLAIGLYQTFNTPHSGSNPPLEWVEGVSIIVAIVIIVLVGSANDYKKERQFLKLNGTKQNREVKVVRSGKSRQISVFEVLVGDVIHLEPGDVIPADGIFIDGHSVKCDESLVTGESDHIRKHPADQVLQAIQNGSTELQTLDPFIISGSKVAEGVGTFLVTATGTNSSYGRFSESLNEDPEATPLQLRLERLAKKISIIGGILALVMFTVTFIKFCVQLPHSHNSPAEKGQNFLNVLIISLTVLVIAVPEGLPLAVTLALAFATTRMMKDNNLVRRLQSCETMGNATAICSDKTGTLTQNEMKVVAGAVGGSLQFTDQAEDIPIPNQKDESYILERGTELPDAPNVRLSSLSRRLSKDVRDLLEHLIAINSTAFEGDNDDEHLFIGSKTETALLKFARHYLGLGLVSVERSNTTTVYFMPFYANHQCMAAVVKLSSNKYRLYVKGAPEVLLAKSTRVVSDPTEGLSDHPITAEDTDYLKEIISTYASCSLRTMGLAYRDFDSWSDSEAEVNVDEILKDLVFLAVVGIQDPLRPDVKEAVRVCQHAGVVVRMVTGDNVLTAEAIAKECGILGPNGTAMEGKEFRNLSRTQMDTALPQLRVIARASPEDKRLLVTALKDLGDVVAVTGDGTNDTLALAAADIGFSMGISGTEVAKEAAAIILMDDNFASIVKAIMWGRAINDAVKKFLQVCISMLTSRPS